jgi:D-alanyl-D-alanine carboxypeptidase
MLKLFLVCLMLFSNTVFADTQWQNQIQSFINNWRLDNKIPAVSMSIKLPNQPIRNFISGTTTMKGDVLVTKDSLFGVGSITKTFISAAILQLQQEGKLNIYDPIGSYFPEYPRWHSVTIVELLNMTSGIPNYTAFPRFEKLIHQTPKAQYPLIQFIDLAYQQQDDFLPGHGWHYSNTNYYLLGLIIEKITHHDLADELKQRFFIPLKLDHTYYSDKAYPRFVLSQMAHAYFNNRDVTQENPCYFGPAGSMVMNSGDILRWVKLLFTPGKVLNQKSLSQFMTTITVPYSPPKPNGAAYGLGVYSLNIPYYGLVWWYSGVRDGYSSVFVWIPSKKIIITAQINSWKENNFGVLMPGQPFLNQLLKIIQ